jgi:hypothetical protein
MSIARVIAMVDAKTTLSSTETHDSVYVGEFMVGAVKTPQYVKLKEAFTLFDMLMFLDYVQMSPLQVSLNIFDLTKQFTVSDFSPTGLIGDADTAKKFVGLLMFVLDANLKCEFSYYYYTNPTDGLETMVFSYTNHTVLPSRPRPIKLQ